MPSVRFHPASASRASILTRENASVVPAIGSLRPILYGRFHASAHGSTMSPRLHLVIETVDRDARHDSSLHPFRPASLTHKRT